ncbi:MAG: cation transporter [Deltaproteobacteria bacterium]|nr:cation transporter [Deltaproteobacteria bacterium]
MSGATAHDHDDDHAHGHGHGDHGHGHGAPSKASAKSAHGHGHGHGEGHAHGLPSTLGRAFAVGIGLNVTFVIVESIYGWIAQSTALMADAAHNLSDVLGLVLAWGAHSLARRIPTARLTYGMRRSTQLAALTSSLLLLVAVGGVTWEAIARLAAPPAVEPLTMMVVASLGVLVNGLSAVAFVADQRRDVNVRAAFLHLIADALVSVGVVIAGAILYFTGWRWIDPVVSLVIAGVILWSTWGVLRESIHLSLDGVPSHIDLEAVRAHLAALPGVREVHDLHVWAMSTTDIALTAHLVVEWPDREPEFLGKLEAELEKKFGIGHSTVQLESCVGGACGRAQPGAL